MRGRPRDRSPVTLAAGLLAAVAVVTLVAVLADMRASAEFEDNREAMESFHKFVNDTGAAASDLHILFNVPVKVVGVEVSSGACPDNPIVLVDGTTVTIVWGEKCVEPDALSGSVTLNVLSKLAPAEWVQYYWTNFSEPIGTPVEGATPTDVIPLPSLPPSTATDIPPPPTVPITTSVPPVDTATPMGPPPVLPTDTLTPTATPTPATATPTPTSADALPTVTTTVTPLPGRGDVNCNDRVDSIDAALVLQLVARLVVSLPCEIDADVNRNNVVDSIDVALLLQFIAGFVPSLPVSP